VNEREALRRRQDTLVGRREILLWIDLPEEGEDLHPEKQFPGCLLLGSEALQRTTTEPRQYGVASNETLPELEVPPSVSLAPRARAPSSCGGELPPSSGSHHADLLPTYPYFPPTCFCPKPVSALSNLPRTHDHSSPEPPSTPDIADPPLVAAPSSLTRLVLSLRPGSGPLPLSSSVWSCECFNSSLPTLRLRLLFALVVQRHTTSGCRQFYLGAKAAWLGRPPPYHYHRASRGGSSSLQAGRRDVSPAHHPRPCPPPIISRCRFVLPLLVWV
jgi:hypothetical protein